MWLGLHLNLQKETGDMEPTEKQLAHVEQRGYRSFLREHEDGSQELLTIYRDGHQAELATRSDKWSTWSAPIRFEEIYE